MKIQNSLVQSLVLILGGVLLSSSCGDADEPAGPAIPALNAAASGTGIEVVPDRRLDAQCGNCIEWGCSFAECGYDTATDPRGACCMACNYNLPAEPKPSCEPSGGGGSTVCSDLVGAAEFGQDYCRDGIERDTASAFFDNRCVSSAEYHAFYGWYGPADTGDYYYCSSCPSAFSCCYGDPWCGDPVVAY
ncbi:MAG TPA: hypothetical protein ENO14_00535 [Chromatiales bacterium]|nr:hypothetical protein [Chromatiales bacterium]